MFTKKQVAAYVALKKAQQRCEDSGLSLLAKQDSLVGIASKYYMNNMTTVDYRQSTREIAVPQLTGVHISDSSADDEEYIQDKWIK